MDSDVTKTELQEENERLKKENQRLRDRLTSGPTRRRLLRASAIAGAGAISIAAAAGPAAADPESVYPVETDDPFEKIRADHIRLVPRTSDLSNPDDGTITYRSDL